MLRGHELLMDAYSADVRPLCAHVREQLGGAADPITELRSSGYAERMARERATDTMSAGVLR